MQDTPTSLLVYQILERFAGGKLDRFGSGDLDGIAGLRVTARARCALTRAERAEAYELNAVAVDNGLRHSGDKCIDSLGSRGLAGACSGRHGVNEFLLVHFCFLKDGYDSLPMRAHGGSVTLPDAAVGGKSVSP